MTDEQTADPEARSPFRRDVPITFDCADPAALAVFGASPRAGAGPARPDPQVTGAGED